MKPVVLSRLVVNLESFMNLSYLKESLVLIKSERFKPCFVTKPEIQVVSEGEVARFNCRVTGYPKPRVMWLLNGHTVINGSKHKLVYDGMWHFDIPKCRDIDE